jgi:hypothetical protein
MSDDLNEYHAWLRDAVTRQGEILSDVKVSVARVEATTEATARRVEAVEGRLGRAEENVAAALLPGKAAKIVISLCLGITAMIGLANLLGLTWP